MTDAQRTMRGPLDEVRQGHLDTRYTLKEVIDSLMGRTCTPKHDPRRCKTCAAEVLACEVLRVNGR